VSSSSSTAGWFATAAALAAGMMLSTLAAFVGGGGLGVPLRVGFSNQRYGQVLAVGVVIAVLCLVVDAVLALVQRAVTPAPLRVKAGTVR